MKSITRFTKNIRSNQCQNCNNLISEEDNFCSKCGQVNDVNPISLKQYFSEYLEGFYSFDNRFFKTIIPLIFKPGSVTREYVNGKRMSYVNPFQLYLHITILFFLMIGIFNSIDQFKPGSLKSSNTLKELNTDGVIMAFDTIQNQALKEIKNQDSSLDTTQVSELNEKIDKAQSLLEKSMPKKDSLNANQILLLNFTDSLVQNSKYLMVLTDSTYSKAQKDSVFDKFIKPLDDKIKSFSIKDSAIVVTDISQFEGVRMAQSKTKKTKKLAIKRIEGHFIDMNIDYKIPYKHSNSLDNEWSKSRLNTIFNKVQSFMEYDKEYPDSDILLALDDMGYERSYWNVFYYSKSQNINKSISDREYLKSYLDRIISKISVALFFLLPIFTFVVALLYYRNQYNYTEHLVFVFHVQTVFFIFLMIFMLIDRLFKTNSVSYVFILLFLIYLYKSMRNFYKQSRIKTLVKYIILNITFQSLALLGGIIISFIAFIL